MSEHLYARSKTSERSGSIPQHSPFQPRPFVVQPQTEEQSEQPDLKTALERAKRYGHSLDRIKFGAPLVQRLEPRIVQAKLTIGEPGDGYEQEADRVAAQVVTQIHTPTTQPSEPSQAVQRQEEREEEIQAKPKITALQRQEEPEEDIQAKPNVSDFGRSPVQTQVQREAMPEDEDIQTKSILQRREAIGGGEASTDVESAINSARGGGQPLADDVREPMEQAIGADFSGVKIHTDSQADQLNRSIQARAFTTGQDVFFRQGEYNPGSRGGQELIAHELTHVVQQNGGVVQRSPSDSPDSAPFGIQKQPFEKTVQQKAVSENDEEIQRKPTVMRAGQREQIPDARDQPGMRIPDKEMQQYIDHVQIRIKLFFSITAKALRQILGTKKQVPSNLFYPHAKAQIASGYRGSKEEENVRGELRFDAAHYMNTTLNPGVYASALGIPVDSNEVQELYKMTASTSNQFQTSNVSSDKVIDNLQTKYVDKMIELCNANLKWTEDMIKQVIVEFLEEGRASLYYKAEELQLSGNFEENQLKANSYFAAAGAMAHMLGEKEQTFERILQELRH